jgi:hypothetical protein
MKKIMVATPTYDGNISVFYADSILNSIILGSKNQIIIRPVYLSHQAILQYARNELLGLFIESDFDELVFIDSDQAWIDEDLIKLINSNKDLIGAPVIRKTDKESYNVKSVNRSLELDSYGHLEVDAVGTGMLKISRKCAEKIWNSSKEYYLDSLGKSFRMAFEIGINDEGISVSEDNIFCEKWQKLGGKVYIDTTIDPMHIGDKIWRGEFQNFLSKVIQSEKNKTVLVEG